MNKRTAREAEIIFPLALRKTAKGTNMNEQQARQEIEALHEFFVDWFGGTISNEAAVFEQRFMRRFHADCELIQKCIFFNNKMQDMPATADIIKNKFCKNDFKTCARYKIAKSLGREKVPADLFPQQAELAEKIINES